MDPITNRTQTLLQAWLDGVSTPDQFAELIELWPLSADSPEIAGTILHAIQRAGRNPAEDQVDWNAMQTRIFAAPFTQTPVRKLFPIRRIAAAAILLLTLAGGTWYALRHRNNTGATGARATADHEIAPGRDLAVLTLADGQKIFLDSARTGQLASQGNTAVIKLDSGLLSYNTNPSTAGAAHAPTYNTISTPRGGQYRLTLPDGTKVWLNAASSLRFPTDFGGRERIVELSGEAYFEVARDASHPFRVQADGLNVAVLGTSFDIMAYREEPESRTSLVEGSVQVGVGGAHQVLNPGWQARLTRGGPPEIRVIHDADMDEALAWKNGLFYFAHADLATVMRQISRWYDVDIKYQDGVASMQFGGKIARNSNLSQVLHILELSKIHFHVEGKTIVVMP